MRSLLFFVPLALATNVALAQVDVNNPGLSSSLADLVDDTRASGYVRTFDNQYQGVKGSPFFNANWSNADIIVGNTTYSNLKAKLNVFDNTILFRNEQSKEYVIQVSKIDQLILHDSTGIRSYHFKKIQDAKSSVSAGNGDKLSLVLLDGKKTKFMQQPKVTFRKADYKGPYNADRPYDEFVSDAQYLLVVNDKLTENIKLNKKNLLKLLADKESEVQAFLKEKKINAGTEEGWVTVLSYYDQL